jgi:hypothetical protein
MKNRVTYVYLIAKIKGHTVSYQRACQIAVKFSSCDLRRLYLIALRGGI